MVESAPVSPKQSPRRSAGGLVRNYISVGQLGVKITELAVTMPGIVPQAELLQVGEGDEGCPGDGEQVILARLIRSTVGPSFAKLSLWILRMELWDRSRFLSSGSRGN